MNIGEGYTLYALRIERDLLRCAETYADPKRRSIYQWLIITVEEQLSQLEKEHQL